MNRCRSGRLGKQKHPPWSTNLHMVILFPVNNVKLCDSLVYMSHENIIRWT